MPDCPAQPFGFSELARPRKISQPCVVTRLSPQSQKWFFGLLLVLATFAVFCPAAHNGFIEYDDDEYIFENPVVQAGWTAHGFA